MASDRRVVVTGIGLITPLGTGTRPSWEGLLAGRSGVGPITRFDTEDYPARIAAEVPDFEISDWIPKKEQKKGDLFIAYAMAAAQMTLADAGWTDEVPESLRDRFGVLIGSGIGGFSFMEREHSVLLERGPKRVTPFFIPGVIINLAAGQVSIRWGLRGPNSAVATACATGNHALGDAANIIRRGDADLMIAGGSEAVITPLGVAGFAAMRALSTRNDEPERASRPWDRDRDGFVIGEGAGLMVLEELEHAKARGARIYAEMAGYGMTADAFHISAPHTEGRGASRAMQAALGDAGLAPDEIDYVNAHGTSTPEGDRVESLALEHVFGPHAAKLAVSSSKSMIGHLLGAAGGVETAVCVLSAHHGVVHPTINLDEPGEGCNLDYVPGEAREMPVRAALSNSFGFGGTNASLVVKRFDG